jgi:GT2 family glycosyltransferase
VYPRFEVLVVDNASTDDTIAVLEERFGTRIRIVRNASNLLFAGGMNVGLVHAQQEGHDFVLLLNNDVELAPDMLERLVARAMLDPAIAAVGPKIYYHGEPNRLWFAGLRQEDVGQHDQARDVDYLTGCAMLIRSEVLQRVGGLDTGFAMYAEDADWSFRAREAGFRLVYAPEARMWHRVSSAAGARSLFKIRARLRSQLRFLRRHARWYHWLVIPFGTLAEVLRVTWSLLRGRI